MARLVDADALYKRVAGAVYTDDLSTSIAVDIVKSAINEAPTVEAIPISWLDELMITGEYDESKAAWRVEKAWSQYLEDVGDVGNNHT